MITTDQLQKIGIPGLLVVAIVYLYSDNAMLKREVRDLRKDHDDFVEMIITRYHIPLTK